MSSMCSLQRALWPLSHLCGGWRAAILRDGKTMTPFDRMQRFVGVPLERPGPEQNHPLISWWFELCGYAPNTPDEVPWCSVCLNGICWDLRLPRSKSAAARSWLGVGTVVLAHEAIVGYDVVVLQRGAGAQPGPEVLAAPGHVGLYAGREGDRILVLGGNQGNAVSVAPFPIERVLGIRRLRG